MPIHFDAENQQVFVDFTGGDILALICGEDERHLDCVGIEEAPYRGASGQSLPNDLRDTQIPPVLLRFQTRAALDNFIIVLAQYRDMRFKE
jgi:hypothetical protein